MTGDVMKKTMTQMRAAAQLLLTGLLAATLVACGGGGGSAGTNKYTGDTTPPVTALSVSRLTVNLSANTISNGDSGNVTATVTTVDAAGKVLPNVPLTVSVGSSAIITGAPDTTDAAGQALIKLSLLSEDKTNRLIPLTVKAGGKTVDKTITVTGSTVDISSLPALDPGSSATFSVTVKDAVNSAMVGIPVQISDASGTVFEKSTDSSGIVSYTLLAPNTPGGVVSYTIRAAGVTKSVNYSIKTANVEGPAVDLTNVTCSLQVSPSTVAVNSEGSTANQVLALATCKNASSLAIANVRAVFKLEGDVIAGKFSSGETASTGTSPIYTGAEGRAQAIYIPGLLPSANQGVNVVVCYGGTEAAARNCSKRSSQAITVTRDPVSVTIGTDGLIVDEPENLRYSRYFIVQVVDSSGRAMSNVQVTPLVSMVEYYKGFYEFSNNKWQAVYTVTTGSGTTTVDNTYRCAKEDANDNDNNDPGEDLDHDKKLEPVRAEVTLQFLDGTNRTNSDGLVRIKLSYPKNIATWVTVDLTATAVVSDSEGKDVWRERLRALIDDVKNEATPAFATSKYGVVINDVTVPAGGRVMPDGTPIAAGTTLTPCQNPD
jgi:hypothetical protein